MAQKSISGRLYDVQFEHPLYVLFGVIRAGDDYLLVVLFKGDNRGLSAFDDRNEDTEVSRFEHEVHAIAD